MRIAHPDRIIIIIAVLIGEERVDQPAVAADAIDIIIVPAIHKIVVVAIPAAIGATERTEAESSSKRRADHFLGQARRHAAIILLGEARRAPVDEPADKSAVVPARNEAEIVIVPVEPDDANIIVAIADHRAI